MRANERNALYELTEPARRVYETDVDAYVSKYFPAGFFAVREHAQLYYCSNINEQQYDNNDINLFEQDYRSYLD